MSGPARAFVRFVGALVFVIAVGGFIATSIRYVRSERSLAAPPCSGARAGACWSDVDGTVASDADCSRETCRVSLDLRGRHAAILIARDPGTQLHAGDAVGARLVGEELLHLRTGARVFDRWDLLPANRHNVDWELAIFCALAIASAVAFRQAHRPGAVATTAASATAWATWGYLTLVLMGLFSLALFAVLFVPARRAALAYDTAPVCQRPGSDCRWRTQGEASLGYCHDNYYPPWCEVTVRTGGDDDTPHFTVAHLLRDDAQAVQHQTVDVELFRGALTRISVAGRSVTPEAEAGRSALRFLWFSAFAVALVGYGAFGLARARRRRQ
jgi:hypothetical protein